MNSEITLTGNYLTLYSYDYLYNRIILFLLNIFSLSDLDVINHLTFKEISSSPYFEMILQDANIITMTKRQSEFTINSFVNLKCIIHTPLTNTDQAKDITPKSCV